MAVLDAGEATRSQSPTLVGLSDSTYVGRLTSRSQKTSGLDSLQDRQDLGGLDYPWISSRTSVLSGS